jgi:putative phage-type endonuclease
VSEIIVETFPSRLAWLKARRAYGIGGSDAAIIAGHEGYTSPYALFADKCGLTPIDASHSEIPEYMEAGNFLEPGILAWWSHRTGMKATPTPLTIIRNPDLPFMFASTDALVGDDAGLDAKNASQWTAGRWDDGAPLREQVQAQHYMAVTGRARWHFGAVLGGSKLVTTTVDRNERFIATLIEAERAWWERHVIGREPPEPDDSEATDRAVRLSFPHPVAGKSAPLSDEALTIRDRLLAANVESSALEKEIRGLTSTLRAMIGDAEEGLLPDGSRYTLKEQTRAEHVVKSSSFRVLRYSPKKEEKTR